MVIYPRWIIVINWYFSQHRILAEHVVEHMLLLNIHVLRNLCPCYLCTQHLSCPALGLCDCIMW